MFFRNVIGAGMIAGAVLAGSAATASADDPPNCSAGDLAFVMSGANANTSAYLLSHPDVNAFFTGLKGKTRDQIRDEVTAYLDANPVVREDLRVARQGAADFKARCDVTLENLPAGG